MFQTYLFVTEHRTKLGTRSHHLSLIIDIMSLKWDVENPFPSYSALAEKAGVTEGGIMKTIQDLERMKLLTRTQRFDKESGAQITTIFDFHPLVKKLTEQTRQYQTKNESNFEAISIVYQKGSEPEITGEDELQFRGDKLQFAQRMLIY